jgi:vacuolar-type H+-ATPase subunit E/Vma4
VNVGPLRTFLLWAAERDAAALRAEADEEGAAAVGAARQDGEARVAAAAKAAHEEAASRRAQALAAARAEARAVIVHAQGEIVAEVTASARTATDDLRRSAGYGTLLDGLEARARRELGPDADVVRDPPVGGVVARHDAALLDLTLPALLELAVDEHADELAELWR